MTKQRRIAPEIKEQILARVKNDGISVTDAAKDHGVNPTTIYEWLKSGVENQPSFAELSRLKRENLDLKLLVGEMTLKLSEAQKKK